MQNDDVLAGQAGCEGICIWKVEAPCTKNGGEVVASWPAKPGVGGGRLCNTAGVR